MGFAKEDRNKAYCNTTITFHACPRGIGKIIFRDCGFCWEYPPCYLVNKGLIQALYSNIFGPTNFEGLLSPNVETFRTEV
jgi:hypothetical protein